MSPIDTPSVIEVPARKVAAIRLQVPGNKMHEVMGPGIREVFAAIKDQGLTPAGAWLTHHFKIEGGVFDFEIAVPVTGDIKPTGRVKPSSLPAAKVARAMFKGSYEALREGWAALDKWVADNGHAKTDELWEVYVKGPETGAPASSWETELNRRLR